MGLIRIGSRESRLAVRQAEIVTEMIQKQQPGIEIQIITMKTTGDLILDRNLDQIGGKGLFVKELDAALWEGRIDLAVHSLKDMPMEIPAELPVFAYTKREDPRDVMVYKPGSDRIPPGGVIATSSRRRSIQLRTIYQDCEFTSIRGNVQTRLQKLAKQNMDGTILAAAGLNRLNMSAVIGRIFSVEEVIPAAGQGILAVQGSKKAAALLRLGLNHRDSEFAALAERQFVKELDGGCSSPVAAYARIQGQELQLSGLYYREDDTCFVERTAGEVNCATKIGEQLAKEMKKRYE